MFLLVMFCLTDLNVNRIYFKEFVGLMLNQVLVLLRRSYV